MSAGTDDDNVIFVAMPGTIRGVNARWKNVAQIKRHLYERVAREVSEAVGVKYIHCGRRGTPTPRRAGSTAGTPTR